MKMLAIDPRNTAMAVAHVFAQTNVGDDHEFGALSFDGAHSLLNDAVVIVSGGGALILFLRYAKKYDCLKSKRVGGCGFIGYFNGRKLEDTRHARDLPFRLQLL